MKDPFNDYLSSLLTTCQAYYLSVFLKNLKQQKLKLREPTIISDSHLLS